jgi:hypothetical protein
MQEERPVPDAPQRRHLVKARTFSRFERQARIGADRSHQDVGLIGMAR